MTFTTMKILLLTANPSNKNHLRLDKETREIQESLQRSQHKHQIELEIRQAVRSQDLQRALLDVKPTIVHFSGHGDDQYGLVLEDNQGQAHYLPDSAVEKLFKLFAKYNLQCVVLNACYSEHQAKAIARHIPYVIGMNSAIQDVAAIEFSRAFYDAIGAGETIDNAYELACNMLHLQDLGAEHLIPVLLQSTVQTVTEPVTATAINVPSAATKKPIANKMNTLRREGLERRQRLLLEKLTRLEEAYDVETRIEPQMRMEKSIADTKKSLAEIDEELVLLDNGSNINVL